MERNEIKAILENLLLAADSPISADDLQQVFLNGVDKGELQASMNELQQDYNGNNLQIIEVAEGFQLCTRQEYSEWIRKFFKLDKTFRLSQPALDTLSIIAYKQPITRVEVEEIRGVDCHGVIKTLLEKKIIGTAGRKDVPGKPIMYKTTPKFLEYFGLRDLNELPTLDDFNEEIEGEDSPVQAELFNENEPQKTSGNGQSQEVESGTPLRQELNPEGDTESQ